MMDPRTGFYLLLKDVENPSYTENATWWQTFSSYVYTSEDDVVQQPHLALKGELLEALELEQQPQDTTKISLRAVKQSYLRIECNTDDLKPIEVEEMKLLLAVNSFYERCRIIDEGRIKYGSTLDEGNEVVVRMKDLQKEVSGVVRYKGPVPPFYGTMFGVEITDSKYRRNGNSDGSCQCKRYFKCQPGSGLFVSLDSFCMNQDKQDAHDKTGKDCLLFKREEAKIEALDKNAQVAVVKEDKPIANSNNDNNAANSINKPDPSNEENEMNSKREAENEKNEECNTNGKEFDKSDMDIEGVELKPMVDELHQQLLKVTSELEEKEKKWKQEALEWEMKMEQQLITQNDLRDNVTQLEKTLGEVTAAKCDIEEKLNDEQKRWKKQMKGFSREWEEFERRLLEERTSRTNLEERVSQIQQQFEQERNQKLSVESELEEARNALSQQANDFERHRQYFEYRIRELENKPGDAIHISETTNEHSEARDWLIRRDEINLSGKNLGTGAWGQVVEGTFRGCPVAVKKIHDLILSPHNRRLFEREMTIASRCRHPCLLQFIGATNDNGNPLFVTELMDSNLRSVLETRSLTDDEVLTISRDVAMALNYLHLNKPLPIIHRDISSANVLLWKRDDHWRAKVSDYGAANFMRQCRTINPGAVIYSAPEALSVHQTPKIDVFSFGLLLCEMSIRELPVPEQTQRQVAMVANQRLRELISKCIQEDHEKRPNVDEVLLEINSL